MIFPKINIDAGQTGPGQDGNDPRASDPLFAKANPAISPEAQQTQYLIIKPGIAMLCGNAAVTFKAYLVSPLFGEIPVTAGVSFSSSDTSVFTVNAISGGGAAVAPGVCEVTATFLDQSARSQITVLAGAGDCCAATKVSTVLLIANGNTMADPLSTSTPAAAAAGMTQGEFANRVARGMIESLDELKDEMAIVSYDEGWKYEQFFTSSQAVLQAARQAVPWYTEKDPNIIAGLLGAIAQMEDANSSEQHVIVIISDGESIPSLSSPDRGKLIMLADQFKESGGVIICAGVGATGDGFAVLSQLATGGFFVNESQNDPAVAAQLVGLACLYCAKLRMYPYYGCYYYGLPGPQGPISPAFTGPQLPCPTFDPDEGAPVPPEGISLTIELAAYPGAQIRYSFDGTANPPDPSFLNPLDPSTGADYSGPIHIPRVAGVNLVVKAIARLQGFSDSEVCSVQFSHCVPDSQDVQTSPGNTLTVSVQNNSNVNVLGNRFAFVNGSGTINGTGTILPGNSGSAISVVPGSAGAWHFTLDGVTIYAESSVSHSVLLTYTFGDCANV